MAAFPPQFPIPVQPGAMNQGAPPPTVPGLTAPQTPPPQALMALLQKRPEQASSMMKQAVLLLEQVADIDPRQEPHIRAALRLLRGPRKPGSEP